MQFSYNGIAIFRKKVQEEYIICIVDILDAEFL